MNSYTVCFANYTIGADAYENVADLCQIYGTRILLIGGSKALGAGKEKLEDAIRESVLTIVEYGNDCTYAWIEKWADYARELDVDMIFGMGGGKALDTAKGAAEKAGLPVFTFPTTAATCAATTALSVVYREDGNFDSFYFYERPAIHCFIDTQIIAESPAAYLRAGMGDTIGKHFDVILRPGEINSRTVRRWGGRSAISAMGRFLNMASRHWQTAERILRRMRWNRSYWRTL